MNDWRESTCPCAQTKVLSPSERHAANATELMTQARRVKTANGTSGGGYLALVAEAQTELLWALYEQGRAA